MSINSFLSSLFGNKSQRDLREIQPIVNKINALRPELEGLSADQLREKINDVRADIRSSVEPHEVSISSCERSSKRYHLRNVNPFGIK